MMYDRTDAIERSPFWKRNMKLQPIFHGLGILLLLSTLLVANTQPARAGGALTVNMVNEGHDANPGDGFCATASGGCTLRAAIEETNAFPGSNNIIFNLPGGGVHVISITLGALPDITDPINLDGTSQPGCVVPCIVLSGVAIPGVHNGLTVLTNNNTIKGFIITSWTNGRGIYISGNSNTVQSNDIGFWPGNPALLPNGDGISIFGSNNLIGGGLASQRNVISGNNFDGISIANGCCVVNSSNVIWNNYIGTNAAGNAALGNHRNGISLLLHADNTSLLNNVISANFQWGIELAGATNTRVRGNKIGTNAAGLGALGNRLGGIMIDSGAHANSVGGPAAGQPNVIVTNHGPGVAVVGASSINNRIERNSIFSNAGLGIDLGAAGVTANDLQDPDGGPNLTQNFPGLLSATSATGVITGNLNSMPAHAYTIEFFSSPVGQCDPSGSGEGKRFIGSTTVTTNAAGNVSFSYTTAVAIPVGTVITATATDGLGSTSEFSRCRLAN